MRIEALLFSTKLCGHLSYILKFRMGAATTARLNTKK